MTIMIKVRTKSQNLKQLKKLIDRNPFMSHVRLSIDCQFHQNLLYLSGCQQNEWDFGPKYKIAHKLWAGGSLPDLLLSNLFVVSFMIFIETGNKNSVILFVFS